MIMELKTFGYIPEAKNIIFKNLITYSIYCVKLFAHVSAYFFLIRIN